MKNRTLYLIDGIDRSLFQVSYATRWKDVGRARRLLGSSKNTRRVCSKTVRKLRETIERLSPIFSSKRGKI